MPAKGSRAPIKRAKGPNGKPLFYCRKKWSCTKDANGVKMCFKKPESSCQYVFRSAKGHHFYMKKSGVTSKMYRVYTNRKKKKKKK